MHIFARTCWESAIIYWDLFHEHIKFHMFLQSQNNTREHEPANISGETCGYFKGKNYHV